MTGDTIKNRREEGRARDMHNQPQGRALRFLFIVQGEGRGHMTQALALKQYVTRAGHTVTGILIGKSNRRVIPSFFYEKAGVPIKTFESPNFKTDKHNKGVSYFLTMIHTLAGMYRYLKSLSFINTAVKAQQPDILVNFYEVFAGVYYRCYRPPVPMVCIGHQYLLQHPECGYPRGRLVDRILLKTNTALTSMRASVKLALSFRELPDIANKRIRVMPPLLRSELFSLQPEEESFLLIYLLNAGYADDIIRWHKDNRDTEIHVFWDNDQAEDPYQYEKNLTFHKISDTLFLEHLRRCSGYMSTAGFESICEALYFGKAVFVMPTAGHFEQACNASDVVKSQVGMSGKFFDIDRFKRYIAEQHHAHESFRRWIKNADVRFISLFEETASPGKIK